MFTVTELRELLDASESTVRRDITALDKAGKLTKVFGGAVALNHKVTAYEPTVAQKSELNKEEKQKIAKYAASLITPDDFVYLDAGTTTGLMLEYLAGVRAAFVTNAVSHAQTLAKMGIRVYLIGGELKSSTEAVVGSQAMQMIQMYHLQRDFRNKWNHQKRRLHHTGYQRSNCKEYCNEAVQRCIYSDR